MKLRNVIILSICQAIGLTGISAIVLLGGIIGTEIAPTPAWATLPVSISVVGVALSTIPAALLMKRVGRRKGFATGAALAVCAALLAAYAVAQGNFALFCAGAFFVGVNGAFVQQYRFAAGESVGEAYTSRAVSLVLLGGITAGFLGPELAQQAREWLPAGLYVGSFVAVAVLYAVAAVILLIFFQNVQVQEDGPYSLTRSAAEGEERPLRAIGRQPLFLIAVLAAAVAYGVMSFLMTAAPIQMHQLQHFSLDETTLVIQSHIIAMYLPSLFTGLVLERLGVFRVLLAGLAAMLAAVITALISIELLHYWLTLVLLGVGWNFLFVGGTVLLTRTYRPAERFKAQAFNDFAVFSVQATAALSSGTMLFLADWQLLSLTSLLPLLLLLGAVLALRRRIAPVAVAAAD